MAEAYEFQDDDVIAPEVYGRIGHPHEAFAWLRKNDPLRWVEPEKFRPFWAVTKHADIIEIEKNPEVFASEQRSVNHAINGSHQSKRRRRENYNCC